jgi:hypothetical protein
MKRMGHYYQSFVGVSFNDFPVFSTASDLYQLEEEHPRLDYLVPPKDSGDYLVNVMSGSGKDCRELVMSYTQKVLNLYRDTDSSIIGQTPRVVYIRVAATSNGHTFNPAYLKKINKLGEIVSRDERLDFQIKSLPDDYVQISFSAKPGAMHTRNLCLSSVLMWIIRNDNILDWCIESSYSSFRKLLYGLSQAFLDNEDWGNSSNENLLLSLFCFHIAENDVPVIENIVIDGPVTYAGKFITSYTMFNYIRRVILPLIIKQGKEVTVYTPLGNLVNIHSTLPTNFSTTFKAILLQESIRHEGE